DRYAAARRSTSFSCSNNRFRRRRSRNSADSLVVLPGLVPASMSAWRIHFDSVIGYPEISGDLLDGHTVVAVASDPHDIFSELAGIRPCHRDILPACPAWASDLRCHLFMQQTLSLRSSGFVPTSRPSRGAPGST